MKANNSLRINMPRALELISFFFSSVMVRLIRYPTYQGPPRRGETVFKKIRIKLYLCVTQLPYYALSLLGNKN